MAYCSGDSPIHLLGKTIQGTRAAENRIDHIFISQTFGAPKLSAVGTIETYDTSGKWPGSYATGMNVWKTRLRYSIIGLLLTATLFFAILGWSWSLRKQVKLRTRELEMSQERYRLLVENASEGVMVVTGEHVAFVNPRALQILGCSEEDLNTGTPLDIVHPDDRNIVLDFHVNTLKKEDAVLQYPFRIVTKKDEPQWVLNNSVKIQWEKRTGVLHIFTDITKGRKLEQQFLQAQKMEAMGRFAGGIAHDFNNILTAILGYTNLLKMKIETQPHLVRYTDNIITSAEKAVSLTRSLLTFTRREATDPKPVDINEVIAGTEKLLSQLIGEDIDFSVRCNREGLSVVADHNQLTQVFMNLATNARDAMPQGGTLTISTDVMEIDDSFIHQHGYGKKGAYAHIRFQDSGIGMSPKTIRRIFEPFFTTKETGKGTGLGLATVYGIVKQHNGYIDVESKIDNGTAFNIYLPRVEAVPEDETEVRFSSVQGGTETILLGEDEKDIRSFMREVLENAGYHIIEAVDGEDAVQKYKDHRNNIHLLLLDVIMPKKNGRDAFREISNSNGTDIKVIFISGYSADFIHSYGGGAEREINFLYKPIEIDVLLSTIRNVLDGE